MIENFGERQAVASELEGVLRFYPLGKLTSSDRDQRGYLNTSYTIETLLDGKKKKTFLRRYREGVRENEVIFEHALIRHLLARGLDCIARIVPTRDGQTYCLLADPAAPEKKRIYAIFEFLPGEDRYTWIDPACNAQEVSSAAKILARFHAAGADFIPQGKRAEPPILDLLPQIGARMVGLLHDSGRTTPFLRCLQANRDLILGQIEWILAAFQDGDGLALLTLPVHGDFHPGNLKFSGGQAVGLFDFDWSKMDLRIYDLGLALYYFAWGWGHARSGQMNFERVRVFIEAYQQTSAQLEALKPMDSRELSLLPQMVAAGMLYVLFWTIEDYTHKDVDEDEYLGYLEHGVNGLAWLAEHPNRDLLVQVIESTVDGF